MNHKGSGKGVANEITCREDTLSYPEYGLQVTVSNARLA